MKLPIVTQPKRGGDLLSPAFSGRSFPLSWLFGIALLVVASRLPFIDHILVLDEAWNIGALRSLASGKEIFIERFWFHPPLYMWLGVLLSPSAPGFEQRMALLSLTLNCGAILLWVRIVSSLFGRQVALYTGIAYGLLPSPLFFDTWVKRDSMAALFGILAVWYFLHRKEMLAGLMLGLAMLGKETAIFYWAAISLLCLVRSPARDRWRRLSLLLGVAVLVSAWWFPLTFKWGAGHHLDFFRGNIEESNNFLRPWWYYFAKLRLDLGWVGLGLLIVGLGALLPRRGSLLQVVNELRRPRYLPLYLLLPGYFFMSFSAGKPPWLLVVLLFPLALLVGLGWGVAVRYLSLGGAKLLSGRTGRLPPVFSGLILILVLGTSLSGFTYESYLARLSPGQFQTIKTSIEIAAGVNVEVKDDERLLIMPMLYRSHAVFPDPIFYLNLKVAPEIIHCNSLDLDYRDFVRIIKDKEIHWVLMSPVTGSFESLLDRGLARDIPVTEHRGRRMSVAGLYRVDSLWRAKKHSW